MKSQGQAQAGKGKQARKHNKHGVKKAAHTGAAKNGGPSTVKGRILVKQADLVAKLEEQVKAAQGSSNIIDTPMRSQAPECTPTKQFDTAETDLPMNDSMSDAKAADPKLGTSRAPRRARKTARNREKKRAKAFEPEDPKDRYPWNAAEVEPANAMQNGTDAHVAEPAPNGINADATVDKSNELQAETAAPTADTGDADAAMSKSNAINTATTGYEPEGVNGTREDPILARAPKGPSRKHAGNNTPQYVRQDFETHEPKHVIDETAKDIGSATRDAKWTLLNGSALGTLYKAQFAERAASYGQMTAQCNSRKEAAMAQEHSPLQAKAIAAESPAVINGVVKAADAKNDVDSVMSDEAIIVTVPTKKPGFERERLEVEKERLVVEEERLKMAKERFERLKLEEQ